MSDDPEDRLLTVLKERRDRVRSLREQVDQVEDELQRCIAARQSLLNRGMMGRVIICSGYLRRLQKSGVSLRAALQGTERELQTAEERERVRITD